MTVEEILVLSTLCGQGVTAPFPNSGPVTLARPTAWCQAAPASSDRKALSWFSRSRCRSRPAPSFLGDIHRVFLLWGLVPRAFRRSCSRLLRTSWCVLRAESLHKGEGAEAIPSQSVLSGLLCLTYQPRHRGHRRALPRLGLQCQLQIPEALGAA